MRTICLFLTISFFHTVSLLAQDINPFVMPKVIPPSPQAAAFQIFGNYPVSYNTGIPDISIPIYTVESGGMKVPIVLRYHPANLKLDHSVFSNIAHGWILESGGSISRTLNNKPDEAYDKPSFLKENVHRTFDQLNNEDDQLLLSGIDGWTTATKYDSEYDIFNYNAVGLSGQFILEYTDQINVFNAVMFPNQPYKVTDIQIVNVPITNKAIKSLSLVDDKGVHYKFGGDPAENATEWLTYSGTGSSGNVSGSYTSSWQLREMQADNGEKISFNYDTPMQWGYMNFPPNSPYYSIDDMPQKDSPLNINWAFDPSSMGICKDMAYPSAMDKYSVYLLNQIAFTEGTVEFTSTAKYVGGLLDSKYISSIQIKDNTGNVIKKIRFVSHQVSDLTILDQVIFSDKNDQNQEIYQIQYNNSNVNNIYNGIDYWGYFNGNGNGSILPVKTFNIVQEYGTSTLTCGNGYTREPNENDPFWISKIIYPTGGYTTFEFEPNYYTRAGMTSYSAPRQGSTARIKTIASYSSSGTLASEKSYEYEPGYISSDFSKDECTQQSSMNLFFNRVEEIDPVSGLVYNRFFAGIDKFRSRYIKPTWLPESALDGNMVYYTKVTEYVGDNTANIGKTVYYYSEDNGYQYSTTFDNPQSDDIISSAHSFHPIAVSTSWLYPQLSKIEIYDGQNQLVRRITNEYVGGERKILTNIHLQNYTSYSGYNAFSDQVQNEDEFLPSFNQIRRFKNDTHLSILSSPVYIYYYKTLSIGKAVLSKATEEEFTGGGIVKTIKQYDYDPSLCYSKVNRQLRSDGNTLINETYYPFDSTDPVPVAMTRKNITSPVIKTIQKKQSGATVQLLQTVQVQYDSIATGLYRPKIVQASQYGAPLEDRLTYYQYDSKGNVQDVAKTGDTHTVYLWSYNYQYPVAKIEGISYADMIAHYYPQSSVDQLAQTALPSNTLIEGIRSALSNANVMITTFTYAPLIGMITATDPKGVTTTYSYDSFSRLKSTTNDDLNIINKFDYHYRQ
jgi:YD repeat-containing protein